MDRSTSSSNGSAGALREDRELALAFNRGEKGAYQAIYDRYRTRVERLCLRMLGDPHDAQEAAQETFLRVYQGLPRFNGRYHLGAWITRITTNVCLDQVRSRMRLPADPAPLEELNLDVCEASGEDEPETFVMRRAESRHVRRVLNGLPPMHRAAIILRDFEGLSYEEVSIALGITPGQTKALIHRARKNFRRSFKPLSALGALIPDKFFPKLRKVEVPGAEASQVARSAGPFADIAASTTQVASSCSVMLQQCGQFVTERFATAATAALVGAAAVGGSAVGQISNTAPAETAVNLTKSGEEGSTAKDKLRKRPPTRKKQSDQGAQAAPTTSSEKPSSPLPAPSSTPSPTPSPTPTSSKTSEPAPVKPIPAPFTPAVGFDRGQPIPGTTPEAHTASVDCANTRVDQDMRIAVWNGDESYPGRLAMLVEGNSLRLTLTVDKDGTHISYDGGSASVAPKRGGEELRLSGSGSYSWNGGSRPSGSDLPDYGRFNADLSVDCTASRVVALSIVLTT